MYGQMDNLPEFVQQKIVNSEWFQVDGNIDTLASTIEYVPADGKTAYLFEAKVIISGNPRIATIPASSTNFNSNPEMLNAALKIDSDTKDTTSIGGDSRTGTLTGGNSAGLAHGFLGDGRFNVLGLSLAGNGVKKIEIENIDDDITNGGAIAYMSGWLSDT